jgi:hypothetical protein
MPRLLSLAVNWVRPVTSSSRVGGGTCFKSRLKAARSISAPVGSPLASRTMTPCCGAGVALVMPASAKAALLPTTTCPPRRRMTGLSGIAASSSNRVGRRPSASWLSCQPLAPRIHAPFAVVFARAAKAACTSAIERAASSDTAISFCPPIIVWMWLSKRPGMTLRPPRSMTRVAGPISASASSPRARMRSPAIASARVRGVAGAKVAILPCRKTRSAVII